MEYNFKKPTQVLFMETPPAHEDSPERWLGGVGYHNTILCGECGGMINLSDYKDGEIIIKALPWVDINEEIRGDMSYDEIEDENDANEATDIEISERDNAIVDSLNNMQLEIAYRKREHAYLLEEAETRLNEMVANDGLVINRDVTNEDYDNLANLFSDNHDCDIADSVNWKNTIYNYFSER